MMKTLLYSAITGVIISLAAPATAALDRVRDFALLDTGGTFHQLSRYQHRRALAVMAIDPDCATTPDYISSFETISADYANAEIDFILLDATDRSRDSLAQLAAQLPVLVDEGQLAAASLGFSHSGEVQVFNPQRLNLFYRGAANQSMRVALDQIVAPQPELPTDTITNAVEGCALQFEARDALLALPPDYVTEVAPVVIENCAGCHRPGGVGPFALDSYIMLLGWSPMIREVLLNKRMPPMQVDPAMGHSHNASYLDKAELQTLIYWIDAGAPQGSSGEDPLANLPMQDSGDWLLGEPDYIVTGPQNAVAATGVMDYLYDEVELNFAEDRWLRAAQYLPGDASVLHHLMTFVTAPDEDFWGAERQQSSGPRRFVEGYAPGAAQAVVYPEGTGVLIPAGHKLSMQFHYVTNGQSTVDQTRLGLYFTATNDLVEREVIPLTTDFVLPPNDPDHALEASYLFEKAAVITGVRARMSYRGKRMRFMVENSAGERETFFSVPAYNYGWQPHYLLSEPVEIDAGTRVWIEGAFDNSISNPNNPDPNQEIRFGVDSWEEMFTGYLTYHPRQ